MVLMIDNYDSFTYNIVQYCKELGANLKVIRNDELSVDKIAKLNPQKIILSPGPSTPNEAGVTLEVIERFKDEKPILGICLGHQSIAQAFGGEVVRAKNMMHGKTSQVEIVADSKVFKDLPKEFRATRYHSLIVKKDTLPENLEVVAFSKDDNEIMSIKVKNRDIYGIQFHPESIMSEYGHEMIGNFLEI